MNVSAPEAVTELNSIDAAQDAYQAWLRARSLAINAARAFLDRGDNDTKLELSAMLEAERKQRENFETLVNTLQ